MNYSEFDGIDDMSTEEKTLYLLNLTQRYKAVLEEAKRLLEEDCMPLIENGSARVDGVRVKSRTTTVVDMNMLNMSYPELAEVLFKNGKMYAKAQDIKDVANEEAINNLISTKTSKWLELEKP